MAYTSLMGDLPPSVRPPAPVPKTTAEATQIIAAAQASRAASTAGVGVGAGYLPVAQPAQVEQPQIGPAAALPALATLGLPGWLISALGIAAAGYGIYQALGGGEGEGLFGLNVLGGDDTTMAGVPFGGPGLAEPTVPYKEWHITTNGVTLQFYRVSTARGTRMFCYNTNTQKWSTWIPTKMAVIGKNLPSHRTITRLRRYLGRHTADAKTILKLTNPTAYAKSVGYRKYKRR